MENINIVYVDDSPDIYLNLFLQSYYNKDEINYSSIIFGQDDSYKTLLENQAIRNANVVIIDSRLF